MQTGLSRRQMIATAGTALAAGFVAADVSLEAAQSPKDDRVPPFRFSLNTATISGQRLPLPEQVDIVAKAGCQVIEPWVRDIRQFSEKGGSLADIKKKVADFGMTVENAIGFCDWCVDDDAQRARGMEQMKRDMALVAQLGSKRIAAPPGAAAGVAGMDLRKIADRYRQVLEMGREAGVVPQLEIWGSAKTLGRMSEAAFVAIESGHPDACVLLDMFHLYKSGMPLTGIRLLSGLALHVFHMNDYPADPPREKATDADRIYPGDGIAPLATVLRDMRGAGFHGVLSLELFNRELWKQDPLAVVKTGLAKMQAVVAKAMEE